MIIFVTGTERLLYEYLKCLCKILDKFEKELGNNFTGLRQVIITPFKRSIGQKALYIYGKVTKKGYIFIDSNSFRLDINKKISNNMVLSFVHAVIHEIGHHLYDTHNLKDKVIKFYNDNKRDIKKYFKYDNYKIDFENEKELREFFADYFCKFHCGELDQLQNEIYDFISKEYELLKVEKKGEGNGGEKNIRSSK